MMGLPEDWNRVDDWISFNGSVSEAKLDESVIVKKKNPEVPVLDDYRTEGNRRQTFGKSSRRRRYRIVH
jgi:hypothetical protein